MIDAGTRHPYHNIRLILDLLSTTSSCHLPMTVVGSMYAVIQIPNRRLELRFVRQYLAGGLFNLSVLCHL
jgi:hypothetical protein